MGLYILTINGQSERRIDKVNCRQMRKQWQRNLKVVKLEQNERRFMEMRLIISHDSYFSLY